MSARRELTDAFVIKWEFDQDVWGVALEFANGDRHNYRVGSYKEAMREMFKHGRNDKRSDKAKISELEVIALVLRAITKFEAVYAERSIQMNGFREWAKKRLTKSN